MIEKFIAVVAVEAEEQKRKRGLDVFDLISNVALTFSVSGALFNPTGGDIDGSCRDGVVALERRSAMHDGVGFKEAGTFFIPLIGLDRDVVFEEQARFGGRFSFAAEEMFDGAKNAIDGGASAWTAHDASSRRNCGINLSRLSRN